MKNQRAFTKVVGIVLVCVLIVWLAAALGLPSSATVMNVSGGSSLFWLSLAQNAWNYFQPGVGVDSSTGLPLAGAGAPVFTDWDLGLYVQAIISAEKLGLISSDGLWSANDRISRVLTFLENRPLMADGLPYLFYSSQTGKNADDEQQVATDAGNLLVALKNLETFKPELKGRIDDVVYDRTNYTQREISVDVLLGETLNGTRPACIYDYYTTLGFAGFWPDRYSAEVNGLLDFITSAPTIDCFGVALPEAKISCDPLLYSIFNFVQPDVRLIYLTRQVYLAHEAYYNATGHYRAFGEANTGLSSAGYVYEWVVMPNGQMWVSQVVDPNDVNDVEVAITPIVCLKVAVGFLAVYGSPFAQSMVNYLLQQFPSPSAGYNDGVDESGRVVTSSLGVGNSMILGAAEYAVDNNVSVPFSCSTPAPSPSSTSIVNNPASVVENASPVVSPTFTVTPSPTVKSLPSPAFDPRVSLSPLPYFVPFQNEVYAVCASTVIASLAVVTDVLGYKNGKKNSK